MKFLGVCPNQTCQRPRVPQKKNALIVDGDIKMGGKLETQCWICPKCKDDHGMTDQCTPEITKEFQPADSDQSYIAKQYRIMSHQYSMLNDQLRQEKAKGLKVLRGMTKKQGELKEELSMANKETEAEHQRYLDAVNLAVIVRNQSGAQLSEVQNKHDDLYRILIKAIRFTNAGPYAQYRFEELNSFLRFFLNDSDPSKRLDLYTCWMVQAVGQAAIPVPDEEIARAWARKISGRAFKVHEVME